MRSQSVLIIVLIVVVVLVMGIIVFIPSEVKRPTTTRPSEINQTSKPILDDMSTVTGPSR